MIPNKKQHRPKVYPRSKPRRPRGITRTNITTTEHADPLELILDGDDDARDEEARRARNAVTTR